ncbi:MAG: response regulator transcription factor [Spirochaetota bacterium]
MNLLIVDDEKIICEGLRTLVERLELPDLTSIRTSYRADDALQIAAEFQPDVLITDIRMPGKSGLELIAEMRTIQPHVRPIVVTGHDDFELVREALRLETIDYLLKPATRDGGRRAIERAFAEVRLEGASRDREADERIRYFDSVMDAAWPWFAEGTSLTDQTVSYLETTLRDRIGLDQFVVMTFEHELGDHEFHARSILERIATEGAARLWRLRDQPADAAAIAVLATGGAEAAREIMTRIEEATLATSGLHCSLAGPRRSLRALPGLRRDSELARVGKLSDGARVYHAPEAPAPATYDGWLESHALKVVVWLMEDRQDDAEPSEELARAASSPLRLVALWHELERALRTSTGRQDLTLPTVTRFYRVEDAINALREAVRPSRTEYSDEEHAVVRQARNFVGEHFHEQHTMQDVAARLGVSYAYFSTLFKQHTGETYSHYLTRVRMEQARRLLEEVRIPVAEVATRVGYLYPKHFTRAFKKYWGVSPRAYVAGER